jgi:hypothetical protein
MIYRTIKPLVVDAVQVTESRSVPTEAGVLHVKPGDWLIRDPQGNLTRCDDVNFKCSYAPLENSNELRQLSEGRPCGC